MKRQWLIVAALLLIPLMVYWPTIAHEYGFRDDYAHLREVREVPGWLVRLTARDGRPVYGKLLELSVEPLRSVADLSLLRLVSTLLLSAAGLLLWQQLRRSGWSKVEAAVIGAGITLLPGAQVLAGWAIAWPITLGLVLALSGFMLIDRGLGRRGWQRASLILAGCGFYFIAGLTYQTTALFAVVPLAAMLLKRKHGDMRDDLYTVTAHLGMLFLSLFSGWLLMKFIFASGVVPAAERMHFETDPLLKLWWFVRNPLPNSLALFALRDRFATPLSFFLMLGAVTVVIVLGFLYGARSGGQRRRWLFAALCLPFVAHSVSLVANSQAIGYRTMLPLSGLFLVLAVFGLRAIMLRSNVRDLARASVCGGILIGAAWMAGHNAFSLIAEPQGREWRLVQAAAARWRPHADASVFLILPTREERSTERVYADEFGSVSSDAEWAAEEMFRRAILERFPAGLPTGVGYKLDSGFALPAMPFDLVVDLRELMYQGNRKLKPASAVQG